jgi:hypothetical protein
MAMGTSASPAWSALYPSVNWSQRGSTATIPNSPSPMISVAMLPLRNDEMENNRTSISARDGSALRVSMV